MSEFGRKVIRMTDKALKLIIVASMTTMLVVICLQVFFRFVLNNSLAWPEELSRFTMVWASLLAAVYVQLERGHLSLEYFVNKFPRKAALGIRMVIEALVIVFMLAVVIGGIQESFTLMALKTGALRISRSIPYLAVPVSSAFIAIVTGVLVVKDYVEFKRQ
jgi:TRAP-type transport system small permease protein